MTRYVALLRGVNVGGHNRLPMAGLRASAARRGCARVVTSIASGNALFDLDLDQADAQRLWETMLAEDFTLDVPVCVLRASEMADAFAHAPAWWNQTPGDRHEAVFVRPPLTAAEVCDRAGAPAPGERFAPWGQVVFSSAPMGDYSQTRWVQIARDKEIYRAITVRNAATALKLAVLATA